MYCNKFLKPIYSNMSSIISINVFPTKKKHMEKTPEYLTCLSASAGYSPRSGWVLPIRWCSSTGFNV